MSNTPPEPTERRALILGTFGLRPKGTMSARAAGIASTLVASGWGARIHTVPWDYREDAGTSGLIDGVSYRNTRSVRPVFWPLPVIEMVREARSYRPDLVYLFKPKGFGDLAARALRRIGYPVLVDMDDWEGAGGWNDALPYTSLQRTVFDWQERTWPRQAAAVTAASRTLRQRAIDLGADSSRSFYLPNGLTEKRLDDLGRERGSSRREYPGLSDDHQRNILLYTRFVEFDPRFVVRVMVGVLDQIPDARLVIAGKSGDGSAEERLIRAARRAGIAERITCLGWIPHDDLGYVAGRCAAALVPFDDTLINRSKCSVKVLELMACGLPIVASAVGENREYLDGGRFGHLAAPHDPASHAHSLIALLGGAPRFAKIMGARARERACSAYHWESVVEPVLPVLHAVAGRLPSKPVRR